MAATLADVIRGEPAWTDLPAGLSPTLRVYLERCLEKNPRRRVRDIGDVRLALEGAFETAVPGTSWRKGHAVRAAAAAITLFCQRTTKRLEM